MTAPLLAARNITKRFGGIAAVDDVSFDVRTGEIHALCGENGAGKSTLIRVLSGQFPWHTFEGELYWQEKPLRLDSISAAERQGIAVIHQELTLINELTVAENLFLGRLPRRGLFWDWPTTIVQSREVLEPFDANINPESLVADLGIAQQQIVEIARALARRPRLLILDEPTAALSEAEVQQLLTLLRRLRESGVACIYISHKLDEVKAIADRITVLRDGRSIITADAGELTVADIIRHMVGRELKEGSIHRTSMPRDEVALRVARLSARSTARRVIELKDVSLEVRRGEILGIGGLMGSGRSELLMHLYGLWGERTTGDVELHGKRYPRPHPRESLQRGLMLVTEDRKRYGLVSGQSTNHNVSLSSLHATAWNGWMDEAREHRRNREVLDRMKFRAASLQIAVERLSGGNQQKVVLSRGLLCEPSVILLDEPTRGVDVGARREIHDEVRHLADNGQAVVWVSSELPELFDVCDRIAVMRDGRIAETFDRDAGFNSQHIMACATGQTAACHQD